MGPKANEANTKEAVISSVSFIHDSHLLRSLHLQSHSSNDCYSVILQHLWSSKGNVFTNKCLHYATLAFHASAEWEMVSISNQQRSICILEFLSNVNRLLMAGIETNTVAESHLFAILFAKEAAFRFLRREESRRERWRREAWTEGEMYFDSNKYSQALIAEQLTYETGFLRVLNHLTQNQESQSSTQEYLWKYCLAVLSRHRNSRGGPHAWVQLPARCTRVDDFDSLPSISQNYLLSIQIVDNSALPTDQRVLQGVTMKYLGSEPWVALGWYLLPRLNALGICFGAFFNVNDGITQYQADKARSIFESIRSDMTALQKSPLIRSCTMYAQVSLLAALHST